MVDTYTTGKLGLIEPSRGNYVDTWDEPLYANWQTLEAAISGTTTLTLSNSNVVLTVPTFPAYSDPPTVATSAQNLRLYLTGTLLANLTIFIPATVGGFWILDDATTGSYTVTIKTTAVGSTGIVSVQGKTLTVVSDGTNIKLADSGNVVDPIYLVPVGTILSSARTTAPPGYLLCDGSAVSRSTYSDLFSAIGTQWGSGDNVTTFNVPNLVNMFLRGSGSAAVGAYEGDLFGSHSHGVYDPGHIHPVAVAAIGSTGSFIVGAGPVQGNTFVTLPAATGIGIYASGGAETRPVNRRVLYIIKT